MSQGGKNCPAKRCTHPAKIRTDRAPGKIGGAWGTRRAAQLAQVSAQSARARTWGTCSFDFSVDNRLPMHDTRWGNSVRISLSDGAVSKNSGREIAVS